MPALDDHALAADLAERAGHLLLTLRARGGDPDALREAGDRRSHEFLMAELARQRPGDAVLSEEGVDDPARLTADRVWIVDPLDGTREFGDQDRTDWAVHVALWERGAPAAAPERATTTRAAAAGTGDLTAGAVALPAQQRVLSTAAAAAAETGEDAERPDRAGASSRPCPGEAGQEPPGPGGRRPLRMVVSRSRASDLVRDVAGRLGADLVPWGSAGAKVATVVLGQNDVYLHSGGFYEWDTAAPAAVARQRGFHVSRIDGSPVRYNRENPFLPDILVCRPAIAGMLLDAIREAKHAI